MFYISKKFLSSFMLVSVCITTFSLPIVLHASDDTDQNFDTTRPFINQIQAIDPSLPTGVSNQKGQVGSIISRIFGTDGKVNNVFLRVLGSRSDTAILRWSGGNNGQFVQGSIFDNGTNVSIGGSPSTNYKLDVVGDINFSGDLRKGGIVLDLAGKFQEAATSGEIYYNLGNVGIGNTNPGYLLDVSGTLNALNLRGNGSQITNIAGGNIQDGTIDSSEIEDSSITLSDLAANSVNSGKIENASIVNADIAGNAISSAKIIDNTIASEDILNNTITNADIAEGTVRGVEIADSTITTADIQNNTIASEDILNNTITNADIADGTVRGIEIQDASITGIDIANASITSADLASSLVYTDTTGDSAFTAFDIDHNVSGSDSLTTDRVHRGLRVDLDSSASGGDTSNEHRVYGIEIDVDVTGDSDLINGGIFSANTNHSTGIITNQRGLFSSALSNGSSQVSNLMGAYSLSTDSSNGTVTNSYGTYSKTLKDSGSTGITPSMIGIYSEVEIDAGTITNAYGVNSMIDQDGGNIVNGYLFHGNYEGTWPTNAYGIHIADSVDNYLGGRVGIGVTKPLQSLHIDVGSNTADGIRLEGNRPAIRFWESDTTDQNFQIDIQSGQLRFQQNNDNFSSASTKFLIEQDGDVGIGTNSTSSGLKLDVEGKVGASEYCDEDGNNCVGSTGLGGYYESSAIGYALGTSWSHGAGTQPKMFGVYLEAKTANNGYAVGDRINLTTLDGDGARQSTVYGNSTDIGFNARSGIFAGDKTGSGNFSVLSSQWDLIFWIWN